MPKTLGIWEWGCPKRGDAQNTVTAGRREPWERGWRPGGPSSPFVWETRVKGRVFSPFPEKKSAGYYHFSLHNRKQALYEPNQSVVNAAFCAKCETKEKESGTLLLSTPLVSRFVIVSFFAQNAEFASLRS